MMDVLSFWGYNQSRFDKLCSSSINTRVFSYFASGCLCTYGAVVGMRTTTEENLHLAFRSDCWTLVQQR